MNEASKRIQRIYLTLLLCNTLAASLIWGINTIFLLDAGLSNFEAFAANAFFTAGMLLFEIPTGVIADMRGRRLSYLLGTVTLALSTILYFYMWQIGAPFWGWAAASVFLGLGFTFFSGAVEAWLVDGLVHSGFKGKLESVFAKGEIVKGAAMLTGSIAGGVIAQYSNLGVPYIIRAGILVLTFVLAFRLMKDIGFSPDRQRRPLGEIKHILSSATEHGLKNKSVKWVLLTSPFIMGAVVYVFYALQPYLLQLYGDETAYGIAGLAAALTAGAQIFGGLAVPYARNLFKRRTSLLLCGIILGILVLILASFASQFWTVIALIALWGVLFSVIVPVRQAYLNAIIPSKQRATILSFDSLLGSSGGVASQPVLGKSADMWGYAPSYLLSAIFQALAIPFALLAKRYANQSADTIHENPAAVENAKN